MSNAKLFTALVKAQAEMDNPVKDSTNPHLRNKYASLASVLDACRLPLAKNGVVVYQSASIAPDMPNHVIVTSMLVHGESGESISDSLPIPVQKNDAQGIGSAITYGRRYMLLAQLGLAPGDEDDDDGNKASGRTQPQPAQAQRPQPAKPVTNGTQHRQPQVTQQPPQVDAENAELAASVNAVVVDPALDKARAAFHAQIASTFPKDDINDARHWFIEKYTTNYIPDNIRKSANTLTVDELEKMTSAMKTNTKKYRDMWIVAKTAPIPANKQQPVTA
jgi:hypothetical protein